VFYGDAFFTYPAIIYLHSSSIASSVICLSRLRSDSSSTYLTYTFERNSASSAVKYQYARSSTPFIISLIT
jgi:hypothetical protein